MNKPHIINIEQFEGYEGQLLLASGPTIDSNNKQLFLKFSLEGVRLEIRIKQKPEDDKTIFLTTMDLKRAISEYNQY